MGGVTEWNNPLCPFGDLTFVDWQMNIRNQSLIPTHMLSNQGTRHLPTQYSCYVGPTWSLPTQSSCYAGLTWSLQLVAMQGQHEALWRMVYKRTYQRKPSYMKPRSSILATQRKFNHIITIRGLGTRLGLDGAEGILLVKRSLSRICDIPNRMWAAVDSNQAGTQTASAKVKSTTKPKQPSFAV